MIGVDSHMSSCIDDDSEIALLAEHETDDEAFSVLLGGYLIGLIPSLCAMPPKILSGVGPLGLLLELLVIVTNVVMCVTTLESHVTKRRITLLLSALTLRGTFKA